jgi:PIN domain nuclease of toxin-antitoxin system
VTARDAGRPARRRLYLDTSAYLCILLGEEGADRLSAETTGAELLSSVLLVLETKRTLTRLARDGSLTPEAYRARMDRLGHDIDLFVLRDLTLDLCLSNILPAVITPRSLDLAHLRTALWFHGAEPIDRFLTMDAPQAEAARELGLPV